MAMQPLAKIIGRGISGLSVSRHATRHPLYRRAHRLAIRDNVK